MGFQGLFRIPATVLCPKAPADATVIPLYHAQVKSVVKSISLIPGGDMDKSAEAAAKLTIMDGETQVAELDSAVAAWAANTPQTFVLSEDCVLDAGDVLTLVITVTGTPTIPAYMIQCGLCF